MKNAYELLDAIVERIQKEPTSLLMDWHLSMLNGKSFLLQPLQRPTCGTVACVAGWISTLRGDYTDTGAIRPDLPRPWPLGEHALLHMPQEAHALLETVFYTFPNSHAEGGSYAKGSPEYVAFVVGMIRLVQNMHRDALINHTYEGA